MTVTINKAAVFINNQPQIKEPKTKAGVRSIPIPEIIMSIIKHAKENAQSAMVCPSAKGTIISGIAFRRAWDSYLNYLNIKAGGCSASRSHPKIIMIENITPHMFRHTYATMLYDSDIKEEKAQVLLGHANIETTIKIYMHLGMEKKIDSIARLNKYVDENYTLGE
jgi:integrase